MTHAGYFKEEMVHMILNERLDARKLVEWHAVDKKYADCRHSGVFSEVLASNF